MSLLRVLAIAAAIMVLAGWLMLRLRRPALFTLTPRPARLVLGVGVPVAALALAGLASPTAAVLLGLMAWGARALVVRHPVCLHREVEVDVALTRAALQRPGRSAPEVPEVAVEIFLRRFAGAGLRRAEAVTVAARCADTHDIAAQVALHQGGLAAYGAYLRHFGRTREVADAEIAAAGTAFPGGRMGREDDQ